MAKIAFEMQPCCGNRSGIGTYVLELASRMKDDENLHFQGNLFNFLGRNDNSELSDRMSMSLSENRFFPYGLYRRMWNTLPIPYSSFFPTADLSVFFNYIVPPKISGKSAVTVCDLTYLRFPETMNLSNLERLRRGIDSSIERSVCVITISEFIRQEIHELLGVPLDKITTVPCAPSFFGGFASWEAVQEKYRIRAPYVLFVGSIEPRKNLTRLLEAFELLKKEQNIPHQLVLAGGTGWNNEEIRKKAESISCWDDVIFTGYISQDEKNTLYQHAAVLAFPSLYEGFGIPPLEAMHHGCPVVTASAASLPEVVGEAAEMVNPLDVTGIAAGLWRVLSDEEYAAALRKKGYLQEKKYTWDASARKLKTLCSSLLEKD